MKFMRIINSTVNIEEIESLVIIQYNISYEIQEDNNIKLSIRFKSGYSPTYVTWGPDQFKDVVENLYFFGFLPRLLQENMKWLKKVEF